MGESAPTATLLARMYQFFIWLSSSVSTTLVKLPPESQHNTHDSKGVPSSHYRVRERLLRGALWIQR